MPSRTAVPASRHWPHCCRWRWRATCRSDELIDAFVLGYEVGARAGGWLRVNPGLHVDGNWPALGAAAAVAVLAGPGRQMQRDARWTSPPASCPAACTCRSAPVATCATCTSAHSATLGLDAALAAQAGFDAPPETLGHYADNYCQASTQPMPQAEINLLLDAYLKPFAAVRHVHYGAIAASRIRERLAFETGRIRRIVLSVYEEATVYCNNPRPSTLLAAQFSLTFGIAAMLAHGSLDADSYAPSVFQDPELRRLEALVEVVVDDDLTRGNRRGCALDGRRRRRRHA